MSDNLKPLCLDHQNRKGKIYSNDAEQSIIIFDYKFDLSNIFIKLNDTYQEIVNAGGSFQGGKEHINLTVCDVPHYDRSQDLYVDSKTGIVVLKKFSGLHFFNMCQDLTSEILDNISYKPLPDYENIYLILENSDYVYAFIRNVYLKKYDEKILAFYKNSDVLKEVKITDIQTYRDGGTTYFHTDHGVFYLPTSFNPTLKYTLADVEISKIEVVYEHYDIFNVKLEHKTPKECVEERIKNMQNRCAHRLEMAIIDEFGPGNWYNEEFQKQIMSKVNLLEFQKFLNNVE